MYAQKIREQEMRTIEQKWSNEAKQLATLKNRDNSYRAQAERESVQQYG
jgi:hypothetical protein